MTIYVPSDGTSLLEGTPVFGSVDEINAVGKFVQNVYDDANDYRVAVQNADYTLVSVTSQGVAKISEKLSGKLLPGADTVSVSADDAKTAFDDYASEVERIHSDAGNVKQDINDAITSIRSQVAEIEGIASLIRVKTPYVWDVGAPGTLPEPQLGPQGDDLDSDEQDLAVRHLRSMYEMQWTRAASIWHNAIEDVDSAKTKWANLIEDRRSAEGRLVAALDDTTIGQLLSVSGNSVSSRRFTIAAGVTGELWGANTNAPGVENLSRLLDGELSPEEVAQVWEQLQEEGVDTDALVQEYSVELANLNGLPFSVMDAAGRAALAYALDTKHPEQLEDAFHRMGFESGDMSLEDFKKDLTAVQDALGDADDLAVPGDTVQLVALGQHDGAATAGISMGNLDTAETVGVFVSGMNSNVRGISDAFDAFRSIRGDDTNTAMVTWVGYRAPSVPEEAFQDRADAGGVQLASFLDGIAVQRQDNPIERFAVLGHSYGTNVGAEALKISDAPVNVYVTLGSAGLKYGTTADDLGVEEIYATHANGDNIAQTMGRHVHFRSGFDDGGGLYEARVDPRDLAGATEFTSEETADGEAVTMHNLVSPMDWKEMVPLVGGPMQWMADTFDGITATDEIGYLNPRSSTVQELANIMRGASN